MREFLLALAACSVAMSAIVLIYFAVSPLLSKRCSAKSRYYAWLILVIGLLIPFRPNVDSPVVKVNVPAEARIYADTVYVRAPDGTETNVPSINQPLINDMRVTWWQAAFAVWAAGAIVFLAVQALRHLRFMRTIRRWSEPIASDALLLEANEEVGLKRPVGLFVCPCISTPMATGLFRPKILLPGLDFDADELHYILVHELVHLKRRDLLYKALTLLTTAVHWFNPIVHQAGRAIDLLCEMSCDGEVVRATGADERLSYSETIIGVVKRQARVKSALSTSFYGGKKGMKLRISSIMDMGRKKAGLALVLAAFILSVGTGFAFAATVAVEPPPAVGPYDIREILVNLESPGALFSQHDKVEGQISKDEAFIIAEDSISRLLEYLHIKNWQGEMGVAVYEAELGQMATSGQALDEASLDPKFSFWNVNLTSPDEQVGADFLIHAMTGTIWRATIRGYPMLPFLEISAENALSGFMTDLGLTGIPYYEGSVFIPADGRSRGQNRGLLPDYRVFACVLFTSEPYMDEDGTLIEDLVRGTLELSLKTVEGLEIPEFVQS